MSSLKIALLAPLLSKASGGISSSVPNLAWQLSKLDNVCVSVVGVEDPNAPNECSSWGPTVQAHALKKPKSFFFAPSMRAGLDEVAPQVIDVQGLWAYSSYVSYRHYRATGTPYVVTPRGMLDPWALRRSGVKKCLVRLAFENAHLRNATCVRATAEMEAEHFRSFGLTNPIAIVPNGVEIPSRISKVRRDGAKRILFLSRIHPKKGIDYLLDVWKQLAIEFTDWELVIAGPDEGGQLAKMQAYSDRIGAQRVVWAGPVYGKDKEDLYRSSDLFVLPTHAENFGLVVAEALSYGVPVITTKNAPWSGLKDYECGWWIELNHRELSSSMKSAMLLPSSELRYMGLRGHHWIEREFGLKNVAESMLELYKCLSLGSADPDFLYK